MTVTTPRILLVSESRITRRVVEMTFADQKVELASASSGAEGLAAWEQQPASVVIADLTMDAPDGLALARHMADRGGDRAPAVLLLAAQGESIDDAAMAAAGVRAVLRKPLDSLQLVEAVRAASRAGRPAERPASAVVTPVAVPAPAPFEPATPAAPAVVPPEPLALEGLAESSAAVAALAAMVASAPSVEPEMPEMAASLVPPVASLTASAIPDAAPAVMDLRDEDLERVAARVAAIWSGDQSREQRVTALLTERAEKMAASEAAAAIERVAPAAASEAAERLVRELAPKLVAEVARLMVADVSERLVREEIARIRAGAPAR